MGILIDNTYFKGELLIPNIHGKGAIYEARAIMVDDYISTYEPQFLLEILTDDLYDAFVSGLQADEVEERLTVLKAKLIMPSARFVYENYVERNLTDTTAAGETRSNPENATVEINSTKMLRAWNTMVDESLVIWQFLVDNADTYPEFDLTADFPFIKMNIYGL